MAAARIKNIYGILLGWLCVLLLSTCSPTAEAPLRLGYLQGDLHHLPAFIALEKGLFKQEGLEVQVGGAFKAGPEEMTAFGAGELDFGYVGQAPATAALLNRVADIRFIAQVNLEGSAVMVRADSKDGSLRALSGKVIAIPGHATIQEFLLAKALAGAGMQSRDIKPIVLKPPEMLQALQLKQIDAFIAWEPYPAQAAASDGAKSLADSQSIWKDHPCCVLIARSDLCREKPETIRRIREAHDAACAFIARNPDEALAIAAKYTGVDRSVLDRALRHIRYATALNRDRAFEFVTYLKSRSYVPAGTPDELFTQAFFSAAPGDN